MATNQSGAMKTLLVVTAAFGGAVVGTLTTRALAPAPALKASDVARLKRWSRSRCLARMFTV